MIVNLHVYVQKKKVFKGTPKSLIVVRILMLMLLGYPKVQNVFFNTIQTLSLRNVKPWSVTCPRTVESFQKNEILGK